MASKCLIFLAIVICFATAYWDPYLSPGPYCGKQNQNQCCPERHDDCSHKIEDSICYCDAFCNRTHDDCCPDYVPVCHSAPQPNIHVLGCKHNGKLYFRGEKVSEDCNDCTCIIDHNRNTTRWQCEEDLCINNKAVMDGVRDHAAWRPKNYTQFAGKKLKAGLINKLGTLPLSRSIKRMYALEYHKNIHYPTKFDARRSWPGFISPIVDQAWCGSDWAVALTGVVSDRFAIQSNGAENVVLSPQTLISCNVKRQQGCAGGNIDIAWNFARNFGLVDEMCFPYRAMQTTCPFSKSSTLREGGCQPSVEQRKTRYQVGPVSRLKSERDFMYDIMQSGPVFAVMTVYQDFFHYGGGIYKHTKYGNNEMKGLHSVRIVGWGEEPNGKYWVVANSWGEEWGEEGYFRIARGSNECGIESFVLSATSDVQVYKSDNRSSLTP